MGLNELRDFYREDDLEEIDKRMKSHLEEMSRILSGENFRQPEVFMESTIRYFTLRKIAMEKNMNEEKLRGYDDFYLNNIKISINELK